MSNRKPFSVYILLEFGEQVFKYYDSQTTFKIAADSFQCTSLYCLDILKDITTIAITACNFYKNVYLYERNVNLFEHNLRNSLYAPKPGF